MIPALSRKISVALASASQSAAATRSANIDTLGADYATIVVNMAAEVNTDAATCAIVVKESDDTTASNFATWSSSFSLDESLVSAHAVVFVVDTRARKRYLRLEITNGTHTTNDLVTSSALVIKDKEEYHAPGTAALVGSTNDTVVVG